jgi:hypothetical protein
MPAWHQEALRWLCTFNHLSIRRRSGAAMVRIGYENIPAAGRSSTGDGSLSRANRRARAACWTACAMAIFKARPGCIFTLSNNIAS